MQSPANQPNRRGGAPTFVKDGAYSPGHKRHKVRLRELSRVFLSRDLVLKHWRCCKAGLALMLLLLTFSSSLKGELTVIA
jgi:hypothetical protein